MTRFGVPNSIVEDLISFADIQSVALRFGDDHVLFSGITAKKMLAISSALYKYCRIRSHPCAVLRISSAVLESFSQDRNPVSRSANSNTDYVNTSFEEDLEDGLFDQDTENELQGDVDGEDAPQNGENDGLNSDDDMDD